MPHANDLFSGNLHFTIASPRTACDSPLMQDAYDIDMARDQREMDRAEDEQAELREFN